MNQSPSGARARAAVPLLVGFATLLVLGAAPPPTRAAAAGATAKGAASAPAPANTRAKGKTPAIEWREWSRAAFDEARARRRLVLLDITASWCHWCRVMAADSYADSAVIAEIDSNFVPIRVDYDRRPDIGDRYLTNGWPTTGVLSANGHLLLSKTYLPPRDLRDFLAGAVHFYRVNRFQVDRKVEEAARAVERTWAPDSLLPPSLSEEEYIDQNIEALRAAEDKEHGGFGISPKTPHWDAISFLLRAADAKRDDSIRALAVRAAAAALALQDSVDGGFFHFALAPDWTKMRFERLLDDQAMALSLLTRVDRATGEARFRRAADRVGSFVTDHLAVGVKAAGLDDGSLVWRQSAGPDIRRADGSWIDGEVYFGLSRAARRRSGPLEISPLFTTASAARMASAFLARERIGGGGPSPAASPRGIVRAMKSEYGGLDHAALGAVRSGHGLLADQAAVGNALLDEYEARGEESALRDADSLAVWMRAHLEDPVEGGFRYAPRDTAAVGRLRAGDKPEAANAEAATFFLRRYWLNGRAEEREVAARTSFYLRSGDKIVMDPARAELALRLREEPLRLLVIAKRDAAPETKEGMAAKRLREAALGAPVPEVVVRYLDAPPDSSRPLAWPDGLPRDAVSPAIYRWTATGWRGPVTDPAKLGEILDKPSPRR